MRITIEINEGSGKETTVQTTDQSQEIILAQNVPGGSESDAGGAPFDNENPEENTEFMLSHEGPLIGVGQGGVEEDDGGGAPEL